MTSWSATLVGCNEVSRTRVPPPSCRSPPFVVPRGGGVDCHLVNPKFFVAAHCVVVWVTVLWGTATCIPCTHGRTCSLSLKGHSRREMGSQKSACACQASYQEGKTTTQECCPKHSSGKWRACARVQGEVEQDQENFTPSRSRSRSPYIGSPLNAFYAECFRFMLQFLCLQMCVYGGGAVPHGGVGDRHLAIIPQGVVGDRLPWGGERQGGGGYKCMVH